MVNDDTQKENDMFSVDLNDSYAFGELLDHMGLTDDETPDAYLIAGTYEAIKAEAAFILEDFKNAENQPTIAIFKFENGYQYDVIGDDYKHLSLFKNDMSSKNVVSIMKWDNGVIVEREISEV